MTSCPNCGHEITNCPECGYATTFFPRHAPRGSGAHYASRITRLTPSHYLALRVLEEREAVMKHPTGMSLTDIWKRAREIVLESNQRSLHVPTKQGLSGRLSELAGMGKVRTVKNNVKLLDPSTQTYRSQRTPLWYLNGRD